MTYYEIHYAGNLFHLATSPQEHAAMIERLRVRGHEYTTREAP